MVAPSNKLDDLTSAPGVETLTALFPIREFSDIAFRGTAPREFRPRGNARLTIGGYFFGSLIRVK